MHLHSFTYDFHLRCIYNYVANNSGVKVCSGYHVTQFLDDFMKYYNKAPNYARNLIHAGIKLIHSTIAKQFIYNDFRYNNNKKSDNRGKTIIQLFTEQCYRI